MILELEAVDHDKVGEEREETSSIFGSMSSRRTVHRPQRLFRPCTSVKRWNPPNI